MSSSYVLLLILLYTFTTSSVARRRRLEKGFYKKSCRRRADGPEHCVGSRREQRRAAREVPADVLSRCFVRYVGCDGSVLIDSTRTNRGEDATLKVARGVRRDRQREIGAGESVPSNCLLCRYCSTSCKGLSFLPVKKPIWRFRQEEDGTNRWRRRRTRTSFALLNFTTSVNDFANKARCQRSSRYIFVYTTGGHTIGVGHCNAFSKRLYNFTGKGDADPSLNATYAAFLRTQCKSLSDNTTTVPMDPGSSTDFDNHYFANLKLGQGLFQSDAALLTDGRSTKVVDKLLDAGDFLDAFKNSIRNMGEVGVLTGSSGEIRKNCRVFAKWANSLLSKEGPF
ncbi:Peroxidase 27, partial [Ananas comosus]